jgi:hypothetical protein
VRAIPRRSIYDERRKRSTKEKIEMDRQEQHREKKEKEREQKHKEHKVYEEQHADSRPPIRPVWLLVVGTVLVVAIVYVWTVGFW